MPKVHGSSTETLGWSLVSSLETHRGCSINIVSKGSGFNGLSTSLSGDVRRIELKTVHKSDNWFAINGIAGIEKLFFDEDYWLYFAIIPENYVICTNAIPFLRKQVSAKIDENPTDYIRSWIALTKAITRDFEIKFIPRMNFKVKTPIRIILQEVLEDPNDHDWQGIVEEVWHLDEAGQWQRDY